MPAFTFFAGKGGVGKTTCAAAAAVAAAAAGARVLALSTDPAHSLGDVLAVPLSHRPKRLRSRALKAAAPGSLDAAEIDGPRAFSRWLALHRRALGDIIEEGTWLDRSDIDALLSLSVPGIDELVGLIEIVRLARPDYDRVVVDTAPTGHTLRLLDAPSTVTAVARVLDELYEEHRMVRDQLARVARPEAADRLIELLVREAGEAGALLRDPTRVRVRWITLPEEMSLAESRDGIGTLDRMGLRVDAVVVNAVIPAGAPCPVCDRRRQSEQRVIHRIRKALGQDRSLLIVPEQLQEPRGVAALRPVGRRLEASPVERRLSRPLRRDLRGVAFSAPAHVGVTASELPSALRDLMLLFVGGKGGVGKTTIAATLALTLGRSDSRRTLLLSTDPAHSLGDILGQPVGDGFVRIPGGPRNLCAREVDAAAALRMWRTRLEGALEEIIAASGVTSGLTSDGRGAAELMDLAPPGMDELFGLLSVIESRERFSRVVVDMAPTGHALRLLQTPDAALAWVRLLLHVLLKYRSVVRPGKMGSELVELSRSIRALQRDLLDARRTGFVVVTRAAEVPRLEAVRLLERLRRSRLSVRAVVVNALTLAPGRCSRCRAVSIAERRQVARLQRIRRQRPRCAIIQTPLTAPPVRGFVALERWAKAWNPGPRQIR
ncbi:MAG TPA: ArsA family ATPase [Vicinamibacterales bacterium]|nr:ArsA family ATPase [Vicinamibacterales bacterium]